MNYKAIVEGYTDDLKLLDAIDMLSRDPFAAGKILDYVASQTNNEKNVVTLPQMNPTEPTFSQDIQLLSLDWEPQYKSQGDLINMSSPDNDEELTWESLYLQRNKYPIQRDVYLSLDHPQTTKFD